MRLFLRILTKMGGIAESVLSWASRHENVWGIRGVTPDILNLGFRWRRMFRFTLQPFYRIENSRLHPFARRLDGLQIWLWQCGVEKNICTCLQSLLGRYLHTAGKIGIRPFLVEVMLIEIHKARVYWAFNSYLLPISLLLYSYLWGTAIR